MCLSCKQETVQNEERAQARHVCTQAIEQLKSGMRTVHAQGQGRTGMLKR